MKELHPFSSPLSKLELKAEVRRDGRLLRFTFALHGGLAKVKLPKPERPALRKDELWKSTCFEAFVAVPGNKQYWELNFSPDGAWNCYRFDDYRQGMRAEKILSNPEIHTSHTPDGFQLLATVDLSSAVQTQGPLELSLAAVIEGDEHSYWALKHLGAKPDFHLRESFVLQP